MYIACVFFVSVILVGYTEGEIVNCTINGDVCNNVNSAAICKFFANNSSMCENNAIEAEVRKCLRTCEKCCMDPQYSCRNPADTEGNGLNCTVMANEGMCTTATGVFRTMLVEKCPGACGFCLESDCPDVDSSACTLMVNLCKNVDYYQFMLDNCKQTCGFPCNVTTTTTTTTTTATTSTTTTSTTTTSTTTTSTTTACSDRATNCATMQTYCTNAVYLQIMRDQCARTCGYCATTRSAACVDSDPNCLIYARNGFCSNAFYTVAQRTEFCGRTCGLC